MRKNILSVLTLAAALTALATDTGVTNLIARQRWPWSPVVDIDYTVVSSNTAVKFIAQYDGAEPFELAEKDLTGDFSITLQPGLHHAVWDPVRAGLGATELKNFRVTVEPDTTDRTYLILNLVDGSYRYMAAPPEDGWKSDPAYYQTNMVFRRIPGGEAILGLPDELRTRINAGSNIGSTHVATLSSDYYLAVFKATAAQHDFACSNAVGVTMDVSGKNAAYKKETYNTIRGSKTADSIDWPNTQYAVAEGSVIAAYRKIAESRLSKDWIIDLPTVVQWERAARATTPTNWLWSTGGTADLTNDELDECLNKIAVWVGKTSGSGYVGNRDPNGWGLYDMVGLYYEWNMDYQSGDMSYYSGLDPVGPLSQSKGYRARRSRDTSLGDSRYAYLTAAANVTSGATSTWTYRLCIHLKSLFKDKR